VQLTATPGPLSNFVGWSGDTSGSANPLTVTMSGNKNITATFALNTYTLSVSVAGGPGSVTRVPNQASYAAGDTVRLTPSPGTGYHFVNWTGDAGGSSVPLVLVMNSNKSVTANLALNTYALNVTTVGGGNVAKSPDQA